MIKQKHQKIDAPPHSKERGLIGARFLDARRADIKKHDRHIIMLDVLIILGSLIVVAGIVGYTRPLAIAPLDDAVSLNNSVLFSFKNADYILIDDNLEFSSPEKVYVEDNVIINLKPGAYYWKAVGTLSTEVRQLTVQSYIDLKLIDSGGGTYSVVNSGTLPLEVDVYNNGVITGKVVVGVNEESSNLDGDKFIGGSP